ncbi:Integrin beta-PS [Amphibalanus amphitrite]|uniref:Integrin beta-PS n=1 Tax=Amphibalanus amphitrite TaxID=1232801 RepID=A0A6A4W0X5_AMPAM|nr:Integrin beta-PS [Amphibalanus amphitrite]KAF0298869.1 Integrin beta-PS [Amphibalanus amphitrite]
MLATRWSAMSSPLLLLVSVVFLLHVLSPVSAQDSCPEGTSEDMCRSSAGSPICSDRGECVCGECHCDTMTCRSKCDTYRFCAECLAFGTGPLASQCETACGQVSVEKEDDPDVSDPDERICAFLTDGGCRFQFVYGRLGKLRVRRKLECPKPAISFSPAASEDNEGPVDAAAEDRNGATTGDSLGRSPPDSARCCRLGAMK